MKNLFLVIAAFVLSLGYVNTVSAQVGGAGGTSSHLDKKAVVSNLQVEVSSLKVDETLVQKTSNNKAVKSSLWQKKQIFTTRSSSPKVKN